MRRSKEQADYPARGYDRWRGKVVAVRGFNLLEGSPLSISSRRVRHFLPLVFLKNSHRIRIGVCHCYWQPVDAASPLDESVRPPPPGCDHDYGALIWSVRLWDGWVWVGES